MCLQCLNKAIIKDNDLNKVIELLNNNQDDFRENNY